MRPQAVSAFKHASYVTGQSLGERLWWVVLGTIAARRSKPINTTMQRLMPLYREAGWLS